MSARRFGFREVSVHFGMFDYEVACVIGPYQDIARYIAWRFEDPGFKIECPLVRRGMTFSRKGYCPIIWLPRYPRTPTEYGTLCHEVLHAVRHLMHWADIPFSADSEEAHCHALGFAVTEILSKLKR